MGELIAFGVGVFLGAFAWHLLVRAFFNGTGPRF